MQMSQCEIGTRVSVTTTLTGLCHIVASYRQCRYTFTANKQCSREVGGRYPFVGAMISADEVQTRFWYIYIHIRERALWQFKRWCTPRITLTLMGQYSIHADASSTHEDRPSTATTLSTICIISVSEYENANIFCTCYFQNIKRIIIIFSLQHNMAHFPK